MDPSRPMLLPKGILTNSSTVYDEVAGYSTLPADKVRQYWHVYTTTNKKLNDPTARRLENFWWHVWGSDRSKLSGRVLARIFQDISLGPTVVPLLGPPNRWEGPDSPPLTIEMIVAHLQGNFLANPENVVASTTKKSGTSAGETPATTPCSSQPPPILKKVGSSASNVTKQTARFIMPHESAEEDDVESDIPSSGSTLANGIDISGNAKVSTQANARGGSAISPTLQSSTTTSELGSEPPTTGKQHIGKALSSLAVQQVRKGRHPDTGAKDTGHLQRSTTTPYTDTLTQNDHKAPLKVPACERIDLGQQAMMRRSQSSTVPGRPGELSLSKSKRSLFTEATASTTNVAAQGTIIDQAGSIRHLPHVSTSNLSQDDETSPTGASLIPSLLEARLTPTRPSSSAVLPLGRTKSQLTLLLEREKERPRS